MLSMGSRCPNGYQILFDTEGSIPAKSEQTCLIATVFSYTYEVYGKIILHFRTHHTDRKGYV